MKSNSPNRKVKVGTHLSGATLRRAKMLAAREGIPLADVIEQALRVHVDTRLDRAEKESGIEKFLNSPPQNLPWSEMREIMERDYFDQ